MFHNYVKQAKFEGRDDRLRDFAWGAIVDSVAGSAGGVGVGCGVVWFGYGASMVWCGVVWCGLGLDMVRVWCGAV